MKCFKIIAILLIASFGQAALAEPRFQIVNTLRMPVSVTVWAGSENNPQVIASDIIVPTSGTSMLIDLQNRPIYSIEWQEGGMNGTQYSARLAPLRVPMQPNKRNFFNIYDDGKFMHNFGGFKQNGEAKQMFIGSMQ